MHVIIGLGNPEDRYMETRHNVGFKVLDYFSQAVGIEINKKKHKALLGEGFINGKKVLLVKPQTYMNLSGDSIGKIVGYYNIELKNILVIYDDIDLDVGKVRMRSKGSAGTHNGMRSIVERLGDNQISRLRLGIGRPEKQDLSSFVLSKFTKEEQEALIDPIEKTKQAIETFIFEGIAEAMNKFNT